VQDREQVVKEILVVMEELVGADLEYFLVESMEKPMVAQVQVVQ
jgi:hypothetical protein